MCLTCFVFYLRFFGPFHFVDFGVYSGVFRDYDVSLDSRYISNLRKSARDTVYIELLCNV